jgi:alcohol dehydrogenase
MDADPGLPYEFKVQTHVYVGRGVSGRLIEVLQQFGFHKVALVVDGGVTANPTFVKLRDQLAASFEVVHELVNLVSEPDYDYLDECRDRLSRKPFDCLVGFGGGSSLDLTKALSVLVTNPGKAIQYRGYNLIKQPGVPVFALPTTAGTGAEVTPNAVFTESKEKRKFGINTPLYLPKVAFLDPLLTVTCPKSVTVASGVDALMQAIESFVATKATPASRLFSKAAFELVFAALPKVVREPENLDYREAMQLGAYYSGIALMNSAPGPAGAMSYPLGVHYKVPHGLAHAVFEPTIVRWNVERGCTLYEDLYGLIDGAPQGLDPKEKGLEFYRRLTALYDEVGIPRSLTPFGISRLDVRFLAEQAVLLKAAIDFNPVPISVEDITTILASMI